MCLNRLRYASPAISDGAFARSVEWAIRAASSDSVVTGWNLFSAHNGRARQDVVHFVEKKIASGRQFEWR